MTTATINPTLQSELDLARPDELADILRLMHLGTMLTPLKRTFTGLTSGTSFDLTQIDGTGETTGTSNPNRRPALAVKTLRITAGTANHSPCLVTDSGGTATDTATISVATISDDGKTLTFGAAVTGFVVEYVPRSYTDLTTLPSGSGIGTSP
jgi:hypothetical protein